MATKFDGLTFISPIVKLISINVNFPDTVQNGLLSFHQIKIRNLEAFCQIKFPSNFLAIRYILHSYIFLGNSIYSQSMANTITINFFTGFD